MPISSTDHRFHETSPSLTRWVYVAYSSTLQASPSSVRRAAVAGLFYPQDPQELDNLLDTLLAAGARGTRVPKALIVPHAGYIYSGPTSGRGYASLLAKAGLLRRVVLVGPSHHVWFKGVAIPAAQGFETPLGVMPVAHDMAQRLRTHAGVLVSDQPHEHEHSLEVQLPFLQRVAPNATVTPIVTGNVTPDEMASILELVWGDSDTLIVVSSDLSHYQSYAAAGAQDASTAKAILERRDNLTAEEACGCAGINGLTRLARERGLQTEVLDLRNSGDTAGDKQRVVGYGAFGFYDA
jgi:AmmeMemoRadiSam system protein B